MKKVVFDYYAVYGMCGFKHICEKYTNQADAVTRAVEMNNSREYGYNAKITAYYTETDTATGESHTIAKHLPNRNTLACCIRDKQRDIDNAIRNNLTLATINLYYNLLKQYEQEYNEAIW